jgi:hypothetical protein
MNIKDITGPASTVNIQNMNVFVVGDKEKPKEPEKIVNPGVQYGSNGDAKWSPPLQQQIDTMKDAEGPTTSDPTEEPTEVEKQDAVQNDEKRVDPNPTESNNDSTLERIKELASIFVPGRNFPAG